MSRPLEDHHVVVTGSSSGIGRSIAVAAAERGAHVLVHGSRNLVGAEETARLIAQRGRRSEIVMADVSDADDRRRLVDAAWSWCDGRVEAWVHNAGADVLTGELAHASFEEKLDQLWSVDVRGTILLARMVADRLLDQSAPAGAAPPAMVFTGWDQALEGMEGESGQMFGPTKGAVTCYALCLAQTLAPHVRVNCVAPGWIQTQWGESTDEYWNRRAIDSALMGRWGRGEDVAAAVMFLISPAASFQTAQVLRVNGGWNRRFPVG